MATRPQVPRLAQILGPAIDAMTAARPSILPFVNLGAGHYADIVAGWEAQVAILVRQIASEVVAARLRLARGDALSQVTSSEFQTTRRTGTTSAVGRIVLNRTGVLLPGGIIPQGFRFQRTSLSSYVPPIKAASYVATRDVSWPQGATSLSVPITATLAGSASNAPYYEGDNTANGAALPTLGDTPFDPLITVASYEAAGGSDGESDDDLVRQAMAYAVGQYGPTIGAIVAGALSGNGVHRIAVFDVAESTTGPAAYTGVAIADSTWATADAWEGLVGQAIADSWQGVGGQVLVAGVDNQRIRVDATIALRSGDDLKDVTEIDAAVLASAASYFDDRPDWYTWTAKGLRAWLSRAHPKILSCTAVTVRALSTNTPLAEPPARPVFTSTGIQATHYLLAQNGVTPTYVAAS